MAYLADGQMPEAAIEWRLWLPLSLSAGFVEELVFRDYFERRFLAGLGTSGWPCGSFDGSDDGIMNIMKGHSAWWGRHCKDSQSRFSRAD